MGALQLVKPQDKSFQFLYAVQLNRAEASCQNCGHAIAQCFYIQHTDTKQVMVVGCECVGHLLTSDHVQSFERNRARLSRAAAQWRKQLPSGLPGESRTDYINRRVKEMANASKAHKDWVATCKRELNSGRVELTDAPITLNGVSKHMELEFGSSPVRFQYFKDYKWDAWVHEQRNAILVWWREEVGRRLNDNVNSFAKHHNANPFDFTKASWDVRKV